MKTESERIGEELDRQERRGREYLPQPVVMGHPPEVKYPPPPNPLLFDLECADYRLGMLESSILGDPAYTQRNTKNKQDKAGYALRREFLEPVLLEVQKQRELWRAEKARIKSEPF